MDEGNPPPSEPSGASIEPFRPRDRSIGSILIASGRLKQEDHQRIAKLQNETGQQYGEIGKQLGVLKEADIVFALSKQFEYPYPLLQESAVSKELVAAYQPFSPQVEALRGIRSRLMLEWMGKSTQCRSLAVVSAQRKEGRSWFAANLAVLFSQLGERTLLIDADLRNPRQHKIFGLSDRVGLSAVLAGLSGLDAIQHLPEFIDLSVLPAGVIPPNPQEIVSRVEFGMMLNRLASDFDVILIDTPAMTKVADAQMIAARAGSALYVAKRSKSRVSEIEKYCGLLHRASVSLAGSVLLD